MAAHATSGRRILASLQTSIPGLTQPEIAERLQRYGRNTLPPAQPSAIGTLFLSQFASPLIYVLVAAALLSVIIQQWPDAGFIAAVLLINAVIGTIQEFSAECAATALRQLVTTCCRVLRNGDSYEIYAWELVPGDIVLLESGDRIPADLRLLACNDLVVDESLLTGESTAVLKNASAIFKADTPIGDRCNMAFAGSLVSRGRGQKVDGKKQVFVKSAVEKLLPMCARMAAPGRDRDLDRRLLETQAEDLASRGYRVIALACGEPALATGSVFSETQLKGLNLLGMIDPLRGEAESAIASCRQAGIEVVMLTGHQPATALAIARKLELADSADQIVTGPQLKQAAAGGDMDQLTRQARVFALVEPRQKLDEARNGTLLRMVLFENIHVFNSRSETHSALRHNRLRNLVLLFGTVTAQLVHIGAMYTPWISDALCIQPVSPQHWLELLGLVLTVLVAMKFHKAYRRNLGKL